MKPGTKSKKSGTADIAPRKSKEDFLRWLARKKKTAVADLEVKPVSPPPTEALMVWADDGGPAS
jgi:hypothetical protein